MSAFPSERDGTPARGSDDDLLAWVETVAPRYRWAGLRGMNLVRDGLEGAALVDAYAAAVTDPGASVVTHRRDGVPGGATIRRPKPMETESFGLSTAALSHLVCPAEVEERSEVLHSLLASARADAADDGVELLILRVDAEDVDALAAAQTVGFTVHEATITFLADPVGAPPPAIAPALEVEVHEGDVRGALTGDEVDRLAAATARWELNHFHADPLIPRDGVRRFYSQWVHNIASGRWCDCLFVARHNGELVGIESEVTHRELRDVGGSSVRVAEWFLVLQSGLGAGRALADTAGRHHYPGGRFHVWETQLRNLPSIRCIQETGIVRPIRSTYTLHAWPRRR